MVPDADHDPDDGADAGGESEEFVPIVTLTSPQLAEMVKEALENEGIEAIIHSTTGHFGQTGQFGISSYRPGVGAYTLLVPASRVEEANGLGESMLGEIWSAGRIER